MITTPGSRILVDPFLENSLYGVRRAKAAGIAPEDLDDVDLVLVTHAHRDHLSRPSLARLPGTAPVIVPPAASSLVRRVGLLKVEELEPGPATASNDVEVTAVPVRHSGRAARRTPGRLRLRRAHAPPRASTSRATPATSPASSRSAGASARTSRCCRSPATNRPASARSTCRRSTPSTRSRISRARVLDSDQLRVVSPQLRAAGRAAGMAARDHARARAPAVRRAGARPRAAACVAILDHGEQHPVRQAGSVTAALDRRGREGDTAPFSIGGHEMTRRRLAQVAVRAVAITGCWRGAAAAAPPSSPRRATSARRRPTPSAR